MKVQPKAQNGKSTIAILAFGMRVIQSDATLHCIAAKDLDAIRDNILEGDNKFLDIFNGYARLVGGDIGSKYIEFKTSKGTKKILLAGYSNKKTWEKILGKPIENFLIDEINIADQTFIYETFARQFSYEHPLTIATLNGDDPDHFVYQDYINQSIDLFPEQTPASTLEQMEVPKTEGWYYSFWDLDDHPMMTPEKKERIMNSYPKESFYYLTKVLGVRGVQDGVLYAELITKDHFIEELPQFVQMEIGLDIGFTNKTVWTLVGYTRGFERAVVVSYGEIDQAGYDEITSAFNRWLKEQYTKYGNIIKTIYPDSADPIFIKTLRSRIAYPIQVKGSKKETIEQRVILKEQLLHQGRLLFSNNATEVASQLKKIRSDGKGKHIDDGEVCIDYNDSLDYALTPHIKKLSMYSDRITSGQIGNKSIDRR